MGINVEAEKRAYQKFITAGMTPAGACALISNLEAASDVVLKKFESPADTGESVCAARAARGQKFYDAYVVKGAGKMSVKQTIESAVSWMEKMAKDSSHGYDQTYRWGEKGDFDCSAAVITAFEQAGVPVKSKGATYTGNMLSVFKACGFTDVTSKINLATGAGLQRGDVLLNTAHHTALYCGNGKEVEASINEKGTATGGKPGDQTGKEFLIRSYRNYPWTHVLRYTGVDNATGPSRTPKWVGRINKDGINVRTGAGTKYPLLASYPKLNRGNLVDICDTATASKGAKWYYIRIAGRYYGYIHSRFVDPQ